MTHDLLVWLLDLIKGAPEPITTSTVIGHEEAIEFIFRGRTFRLRLEEVAA